MGDGHQRDGDWTALGALGVRASDKRMADVVSNSKYHASRAGMEDYKDWWQEREEDAMARGQQGDLLPIFSTTQGAAEKPTFRRYQHHQYVKRFKKSIFTSRSILQSVTEPLNWIVHT